MFGDTIEVPQGPKIRRTGPPGGDVTVDPEVKDALGRQHSV